MAILVTGGAGYIGSVTVELLASHNQDVVVLDNLSRGHRKAVAPSIPFYQGNVGDRELVTKILREHSVDSVIHFAAFAYVGESVTDPGLYFENNVAQGIALLRTLVENGVKKFVFSSTCATYGEPVQIPMAEDHPQSPANPYGWTKYMIERVLETLDAAHGLRFVALRYFNASGATVAHGEHHAPETHLIPNVLFAALGKLPYVSVFGDNYPTPDGTAIRDYIHVTDLGSAHIKALEYLKSGGASTFINLGSGNGYSVLEVIDAARRVTGLPIEARIEPPRAGDPSHLVAQDAKARSVLGWKQEQAELETILRTAYEWHLANPSGYDAN